MALTEADAERLADAAGLGGRQREVWLILVIEEPQPTYRSIGERVGLSTREVCVQAGRAKRKVHRGRSIDSAPQQRPDDERDDDGAPLAEQSCRQQARQLWAAMQGPDRSQPPAPLDPVEGDRDRITAQACTVHDVQEIIWRAEARRARYVS